MKTTIQMLQLKKRVVKTAALCLVILLLSFKAQANKLFSYLNYNNDTIAIYKFACKYLVAGRSSYQKIQIQKQTSLTVIKKFDFKHPSYHVLDTSHFNIDKKWTEFLNNINTTHLKNSNIRVDKIISLTLSPSKEKPNAMITFSPAIISHNNSLAVCAYKYIDNSGNDVQGVLLLEKPRVFWQVYKLIKMSSS